MSTSQRMTGWTLGALALGGAVGLLVHFDGPHPPSTHGTAAAATVPDLTLRELARLDGQIPARTRMAEETRTWLNYELVASDYMARARLSNDWNDYRHAQEMLDRGFAIAPEGAGPWNTQASLDYTLHRLPRCEQDLQHIEHFAVYTIRDQAYVRSLRADVAFHSGHYDVARRLYDEQLAASRSISNLVAHAQLDWKTDHVDAARALMAEAAQKAEHEPPGTHAWLAFVNGQMELDLGHDEEALHLFDHAAELMPGWPLVMEHAAEVRLERGDRAHAKEAYTALVARTHDPEFMDQLARIAREEHDDATFRRWRDQARTLHRQRMAMFPEAAYGHALEHWMDLENDTAQLVSMAEHNRDARPGGEAWTKLVEAYLVAGRTADAVHAADALAATGWSTGESHAASALAYRLAGDTAKADAEHARAEAVCRGANARLEDLEARVRAAAHIP
jgi:tetratricopeptide (TPR) repeat protein